VRAAREAEAPPASPRLYLVCGLPFAGKTTLATALVRRLGLAHVSIDGINTERGLGFDDQPISSADWTATYDESYRRVERSLRAGRSVLYDAANFTRSQRDEVRAVAARQGAPATVVHVDVPEAEARRRLRRNRETGERYDVRDDDFANVVRNFEPPHPDEQAIRYDPSLDLDAWVRRLLEHPQ